MLRVYGHKKISKYALNSLKQQHGPSIQYFGGPSKKADAAVEMFHHKMDLGMHRCVEEEEEEEKNHLIQVSKRSSLTLECNASL